MSSDRAEPGRNGESQLMAVLSYINSLDRVIYAKLELGEKDNSNKSLGYYYSMRNKSVVAAVVLAKELGYKTGFVLHEPFEDLLPKPRVSFDVESMARIVEDEPVWEHRFAVVAIIELPTGQVSWHLDSDDLKYDGHSNQEKGFRIDEYVGVIRHD